MLIRVDDDTFDRCERFNTNRLKYPSKLRLKDNDEHNGEDINKITKYKSDHLQSQKTTDKYKYQYEYNTFDKLPCSALFDKKKSPVKKECNKEDIADRTNKISPSAEEQVAVIQTFEQFVYEICSLINKRQFSKSPLILVN